MTYLSPFVSATLMICVHDFPYGEVSVKVGVMEFGLNATQKCEVMESVVHIRSE